MRRPHGSCLDGPVSRRSWNVVTFSKGDSSKTTKPRVNTTPLMEPSMRISRVIVMGFLVSAAAAFMLTRRASQSRRMDDIDVEPDFRHVALNSATSLAQVRRRKYDF